MKFASGLIPYTDAERRRDAEGRAAIALVQHTRRKAAPRGRYDVKPTPSLRRIWLRMIGENEETAS